MSRYLGDFAEDATIDFMFTTNNSSGGRVEPSTAFEAADLKIYKDNGTAEKTSTNGITMTSPFDANVGVQHVRIDTSNDTGDAGFWVTGSDYFVVLYPDETIDGQNISAIVAHFSIQNRYDVAASVTGSVGSVTGAVGSVTAGVSLAAGAVTNASLAGNMEIVFETDFATNYNTTRNGWATNVQDTIGSGNLPADVTAISGDATAADNLEADYDGTGYNKSASTIGTCTTNTDMRGTDSALLAASAPTNFGDLSITVTTGRVDVASIEGSDATNQIRDAVVDDATRIDASALNTASGAIGSDGTGLTEAGGTGDHLTAVPWNSAWDAEVQSEVNDALVAIHLDHLFAVDYDPASKPGVATALWNELIVSDAGVSQFSTNALENAPSGGGGGDATAANQTTIINHLTDIKGATWSSSTDTLEAIRDQGDSAWITATGFSTHSETDVWAAATRTLTAGTNIALAKGVGVTGFNDVSAADVNAQCDISLSDYAAGTLEGSLSRDDASKVILAASAGKLSGAATTSIAIRDTGDTKNVISATVDSDGNRSAVTLNP